MDEGYRLLQHVVRQVFGNLGQAARLTLLLTVLPMLGILYFQSVGPAIDPATYTQSSPIQFSGATFLLLIVNMITTAWAAVGWHRYVLLEEHGNGVIPQWHGRNVRSYIWRLFLLGLALVVVLIVAVILLSFAMLTTRSTIIGLIAGIGITMGISWFAVRIGMVLPAAALGQKMTFGESWEATKPVSTDILVPILVLAIASTIASQVVQIAFGNGVVGIVPNALIYWLHILLNLSLMTTIYGTQVEGRALT